MLSERPTMDDFDTIVIGAGLAGVTAARLLEKAGRRVVVLEARDRIGGRMHTDRTDGIVTDLGASWIHGINDSPVFAIAQALALPTVEFTVGGYQPDSRPLVYFAPDGARLTHAEARRFADDIRAVDATLADVIASSTADASYQDVTEAALARQGWDHERTERVREYLQHRTEEQYGAWIGDLGAHGLDDDTVDGDEMVFPDGYARIPELLAEGLDVRLSTAVSRVSWSSEGVVVTSDGGEYRARTAIVTVPTGVLRADDFVIDPPLPPAIAGPLSRLPMNAFEKIVLRFPTRWWDADVYGFRQQGPEGRWWHSWYDLTRLHGTPTLLTFAAGDAARQIRTWTDEQVVEAVLAQLRRPYGDRIERPTSIRITHWQDDPFSHGSYAYMAVGSKTSDHDDLAEPIGGVLHLAGEATWTDDPATVPGALLSGHRAAQRVLGHEIPLDRLWSDWLSPRPSG